MGLWRVMWTGCLGMCCLIPMAWLSFNVLDLGAAISNGLFIDLGPALDTIFESIIPPEMGWATALIPILVEGTLGVTMLIFFPLHWALYYRPDAIGFAFAIILPWILTGTITAALFCKSAKKGFDTGLGIGVGLAIGIGVIPYILSSVLSSYLGFEITTLIDGVFAGMTDLPYLFAVITATLEGGLIGGIFGGFIGSLRYDPEAEETGKKSKKKTKEPKVTADSFGGSASSTSSKSSKAGNDFCPNCGAKTFPGDPFCPNCGSKL